MIIMDSKTVNKTKPFSIIKTIFNNFIMTISKMVNTIDIPDEKRLDYSKYIDDPNIVAEFENSDENLENIEKAHTDEPIKKKSKNLGNYLKTSSSTISSGKSKGNIQTITIQNDQEIFQ